MFSAHAKSARGQNYHMLRYHTFTSFNLSVDTPGHPNLGSKLRRLILGVDAQCRYE